MNIEIHPEVLSELEYIVKLHREHGAPNRVDNVEDLIAHVLASVAEGSRRPGSWERRFLEELGLVADCEQHQAYRPSYGEPE